MVSMLRPESWFRLWVEPHGPGPGWGPYGPIWALMGPPGQVLAGPDMSDFRVLVEFRMFWVQN